MALEDQQRLEEIYNTKLHRLRLLEKRQAVEGFNTPPEVIIEIEKTRAEMQPVENALAHAADVQTAEDLGAGGRFLALDKRVSQTGERIDERFDRFEQSVRQALEKTEQRIQERITRSERASEQRMDRMEEHADERYRSQETKHEAGARLYQFLFVLLSIGLIISLVIGAFLIGGAFR